MGASKPLNLTKFRLRSRITGRTFDLLIERFSYDLEPKTREQSRNDKRVAS